MVGMIGFGSKPDPHGFLHCCQIAGVTPAASIMVGDTMADYGAAIAAKAGDFICVADIIYNRPHQDIHHENVIGRIDQLPGLMARRSLR